MAADSRTRRRRTVDPSAGLRTFHGVNLDELDRQIVDLLVQDGRMPYRVLGEKVGLSPSATADRVRALIRRGVIARFTAVVDDNATRRDVEAVVDLRLASESDRQRFERSVAESDAVVEAMHLTGPWDYQLPPLQPPRRRSICCRY